MTFQFLLAHHPDVSTACEPFFGGGLHAVGLGRQGKQSSLGWHIFLISFYDVVVVYDISLLVVLHDISTDILLDDLFG